MSTTAKGHGAVAPLVSVVVDTCNHERFIADAVTSVLEQDYRLGPVEVLVVDDGSQDGTAQMLSRFVGSVRMARKENGGQASALNLGARLAQGDIIAFLDGDDWWDRGKLQAVVGYMVENPAVGMVGHGIVEVAPDGSRRNVRPGRLVRFDLTSDDGVAAFRRVACFLGTSRLTCRRRILERLLPIPESMVIEADEYLFTLGCAIAEVAVLDELLCFYRLHGNNLYQFSADDPVRIRRKHTVLAQLAEALPRRLVELGVSEARSQRVVQDTTHDSRRLALMVHGGHIGQAFPLEWAILRDQQERVPVKRLPLRGLGLLLALALPPRLFYRLRRQYSRLRQSLLPRREDRSAARPPRPQEGHSSNESRRTR